jgi:hypothetical protein
MRRTTAFASALLSAAVGCSSHHHAVHGGHVDMYLMAPQARSVVLVVSGNPFQRVPGERDAFGMWKVTVNRVDPFTYFYLVDDQTVLPDCRMREHDDFGSNNCVFSP